MFKWLKSVFRGLSRWAAGLYWVLSDDLHRLTADPRVWSKALDIVLLVSQYANLTAEERRARAISLLESWLVSIGVKAEPRMVVAVVELAYNFVRAHFPGRVGPKPFKLSADSEGGSK